MEKTQVKQKKLRLGEKFLFPSLTILVLIQFN